MGKALRSNSKKAVRRSRRSIVEKTCGSRRHAELEKQEILQQILAAPKPVCANEKGSENKNDVGELVVNVTLINSQRRMKRRSRFLQKQSFGHSFVVGEHERKKIAKKREKADGHLKAGATLAPKQESLSEGKAVIMRDVKRGNQSLQHNTRNRRPPGSQWLKYKKLVSRRRLSKKPIKRRYKHDLTGIIQYYPIKRDDKMQDVVEHH